RSGRAPGAADEHGRYRHGKGDLAADHPGSPKVMAGCKSVVDRGAFPVHRAFEGPRAAGQACRNAKPNQYFTENSAAMRGSPLQKSAAAFKRRRHGEMAEWLKAHAWKACVRETVPWVRIPLSPPKND